MEMRVLVTGITGQDGSILAEKLLRDGHTVYGCVRRTSFDNMQRIAHLIDMYRPPNKGGDPEANAGQLHIIRCEMTENPGSLVTQYKPDLVFNLAAMSDVKFSYQQARYCMEVNYHGAVSIFDAALELHRHGHPIRVYQASTSEMFGDRPYNTVLNEQSEFRPTSPYAISKLAAHMAAINIYRRQGLYIICGILFNHTSAVRGPQFMERKIADNARRIDKLMSTGSPFKPLYLGNLNAYRDIGCAVRYVDIMFDMLTDPRVTQPAYVVATGVSRSVREIVCEEFSKYNRTVEFTGSGEGELGRISGEIVVKVDPDLMRPTEVNYLCGDASLIEATLGIKI